MTFTLGNQLWRLKKDFKGRKGQINTTSHREKISLALIGRIHQWQEGDKNYFHTHKYEGIKNCNWAGGRADRFRRLILKRDDYTCQVCGLKDEEIVQVDHIKPRSKFPELSFDISNGRTLCPNCHERKSNKEKGRYGKR